MARSPLNLFTSERKSVLTELMGSTITDEEISFLEVIGEYAAGIWKDFDAINNPENGHKAFLEARRPLITDEIGFRGCFLPEEVGGFGISMPVYMMGLEIIAQANASISLALAIDSSVLNSITHLGTPDQKKKYVNRVLDESRMTCFALTEPQSGSDARNILTRAVREGDHYILNGQKTWITNAGEPETDYYYVVSKTNDNPSKGSDGISVILVHQEEISNIVQIPKFTVPGSFTAELFFDESKKVPVVDNGVPRLLGEWDNGFRQAKNLLNNGRVTIAAYGLGIATEALEMAWDYGLDRQSGGCSLARYQSIGFTFAELEAKIDAARLLTYRAAVKLQTGASMAVSQDASKAKLFANDLAHEITQFNIDLHGAYGLSKEYRPMQLFHDARVGVTGEGTAQVQKAVISSAKRKFLENQR